MVGLGGSGPGGGFVTRRLPKPDPTPLPLRWELPHGLFALFREPARPRTYREDGRWRYQGHGPWVRIWHSAGIHTSGTGDPEVLRAHGRMLLAAADDLARRMVADVEPAPCPHQNLPAPCPACGQPRRTR